MFGFEYWPSYVHRWRTQPMGVLKEEVPGECHLCHLEGNIAVVVDYFGPDFYQIVLQTRQRPIFDLFGADQLIAERHNNYRPVHEAEVALHCGGISYTKTASM